MNNMSVTLNQGLRNYQESVTHQIGSLNVTINLCPSASNILIHIPTLNTVGVHIMSPMIIYNYQLRSIGMVDDVALVILIPLIFGGDFN